ncbi:MAG TPA: hypothetical protein VMZ53_28245, partial [Kofleriaceae bacterium]|nr:hypothetical protein [Kofleriaceae bacterium]
MKRTALATLALTACLSVPEPPASKTHHWKELAGANQPVKLHGARMTWDDERKSIVLFGGVVDNRP